MESMRRRQLEARRLSESSPIAGLGTYQVMRPSRGRDTVAPQKPVPRPPRLPNGSDAFGLIDAHRIVEEIPLQTPRPQAVALPLPDPTMMVAQRLYRAEIAPPPRFEKRATRWLLPMSLATAVSTVILALALWLR